MVRLGVWERGTYIGVIIFSRGASPNLLNPYGLRVTEGCELTRIAMGEHRAPISRMVSIALRKLQVHDKGLRLVVSFADPNHDHLGSIYQAGNWVYTGSTAPTAEFRDAGGKRWHERQVSKTGWTKQYGMYRRTRPRSSLQRIRLLGKHRYLYPLDKPMRQQIECLRLPYPKRQKDSSEPPSVPLGEGGAAPTLALQR